MACFYSAALAWNCSAVDKPYVAFLIVLIFGFANAGVSFAGFTPAALLDPVPVGIAARPVRRQADRRVRGVMGSHQDGFAKLPDGATWRQFYGVALLCGIGFTMSFFIGLLAFPTSPILQDEVKLGVIMGSVLSGLVATMVRLSSPARAENALPA